MTKQQFIDKFFIEYDKIASLGAPGYTLQELSTLVSEAQESLVIKKYTYKSNRLNEGFEETEKRTEEIGELVRYKTITTFTAGFFDNAIYALLPNTLITSGPNDYSDVYWYSIYEQVVSNVLDCTIPNNTTVYVKPLIADISHDAVNIQIENPFKKPFIKGNRGRVFRLRSEGRKHQLITDGAFNITAYKIGYIRKPTPIDMTVTLDNPVCELSDSFHRELLHETVELAKAYVQDPSYQITQQQIKE